MFRFEHPEYLLTLIIVLLIARLFYLFLQWRKNALKRWSDEKLLHENSKQKSQLNLKFLLAISAITLLSFTLANPQWRTRSPVKHEGIDVALLIDASSSMLAEDVKPNRLAIAKQLAQRLTDEATNERIAVVEFASNAYMLSPLTQDHAVVKTFLQSITTDAPQRQGSDIGNALLYTIKALPENQNHYKAIVLFSDGEDQEKQLNEALQAAHQNNVIICTVGIGTEKGATIPDSTSGFDQKVKHDVDGNVIVTKLNPVVLKTIADKADGISVTYSSDETKTIQEIMLRLNKIMKNVYDEKLFSAYETKARFLLIPVLLLLLIEFFAGNVKFFRRKLNTK